MKTKLKTITKEELSNINGGLAVEICCFVIGVIIGIALFGGKKR